MRILSVDDDARNLYLIEVAGRAHGYEVVSARNGLEALEQMNQQLPDLIISDILMPEMDGFQFCHEVKSRERTRNIPFIFYTATYTSKQDEELAIYLGASRFLVKPMDLEPLMAMIAEVASEVQRGEIAAPEIEPRKTAEYLKAYNARLIHRLDHKIEQLEAARRELQEMLEARDREIAQRRHAEEERSRMEAQFLQAQKLENIGRLAAGITHDFNNLLTIINGYSELLLQNIQESDPIRRGMQEILAAGERAAKLTKQLLVFSRSQVIDMKPLDLKRTVEQIRSMLQRLVGDDLEVVTKLSSVGLAMFDEGQLHQVLLNLVVNARDAMPLGGRLTIETANVETIPAAEGCAVQPGPYLLLSVTDTGTGMDRRTLEHIFEPFFTTKAEGEGTGLGLSTVHEIVRQSGGWIHVDSELGCGSAFRIYLPEHRAPEAAGVVESVRPPAELTAVTETVLVVDDYASVRSLMVNILKRRGYRVLEAATGVDAVALAERHVGAIDLLLTDVQMPRIYGPELAKQLRIRRPNLRVLFVSGDLGGPRSGPALAGPGVSCIGKPFGSTELAAKVRELLDSSRVDASAA